MPVCACRVIIVFFGCCRFAIAQPAPITCTASTGGPPAVVRAEGIAELVADLVLKCTGGTPTKAGAPVPLVNVQISLNTNVTSRLLVPEANLSEATLLIDEPNAGADAIPINAPLPPGSPRQILWTPQGYPCPINGVFSETPNVFTGVVASASSIAWLCVPLDPPGENAIRVIRITNVRANACQLSGSATAVPAQVVMLITITCSQPVIIDNPQQAVAIVQPGLVVGGTSVSLSQCITHNASLLEGDAPSGFDFTITVTEGFASAFRRRNIGLTPDGVTAAPLYAQNVPGYPYNTESGFYAPGLFTATPNAGFADSGTRIRLSFGPVDASVHIFVPVSIELKTSSGSVSFPPQPPAPVPMGIATGQLRLVQTNLPSPDFAPVQGGVAQLAEVNNTGTAPYAVYEVVNSDPDVIETAIIPVSLAFTGNSALNLPALGQVTVNVSLAPPDDGPAALVPRFCDRSTPRPAFFINRCTCNLLFPFVTNQAGFDTGIAIANTSKDDLGTAAQAGTVTLYYYGFTVGGGPPAPQTSEPLNAGEELLFTLSGGGNKGIQPAPGFQGYMIAVSGFQYCHAFAFISKPNTIVGYLALQLDVPGLNRTGIVGENEGH